MKPATVLLLLACSAFAQQAPRPPQFVSPEVSADRKVTFRLHAPNTEAVTLTGGDIPDNNKGAAMTKGAEGVWEVTLGPLVPGAYRYLFNIAGVSVVDRRFARPAASPDQPSANRITTHGASSLYRDRN